MNIDTDSPAPKSRNPVRTLFISNCKKQAELLRQAMIAAGLFVYLNRIDQDPNSIARARELNCGDPDGPEFVIFELIKANSKKIELLESLVSGNRHAHVPVIVLTSSKTERLLLDRPGVQSADYTVFSPIPLKRFLNNLRSSQRERFLGALATLYDIGPILVQAPKAMCGLY